MDSARQREQLERYLKWVKEEGGVEGPTHLDTLMQPCQQERLKWLKEHCKGKITEIGCCYGFILAYCYGHIGVDWNEKSILLARILNPGKEFVVADAKVLPFPDKSIDTVMLPDILEHLDWEDVEKAVRESMRVSKERILITFPDGDLDSKEALSFKHRFLFTSNRKIDLLNMLYPWNATIYNKSPFNCVIAKHV